MLTATKAISRFFPLALIRSCSVSAQPKETTQSDLQLSKDHLGLSEDRVSKVYTARNKDIKELFPRGLTRSFQAEIDCFGETGWILRPQTYDIITQLQYREEKGRHSRNNYLIWGRDGSGKSICLNQVVHWCWKAGWLVVHIPGVTYWSHCLRELRPSPHQPGTYDQPHEASVWLKQFRSINSGIIKDIKLSEDHAWTRHEKSEKGEELGSVIERGLHKPALATDVVKVVLEELVKEKARRPDELKLLLAVDEFNFFFNPCRACVSKFEPIEPQQLNLIKHFLKYIPTNEFPGGVVLALSRKLLYKHSVHSVAPRHMLGKEGMEGVADYHDVEVDNFTHEEFQNFLDYFRQKKWITKEPYEQLCQEVWQLTEGNPAELANLSPLL